MVSHDRRSTFRPTWKAIPLFRHRFTIRSQVRGMAVVQRRIRFLLLGTVGCGQINRSTTLTNRPRFCILAWCRRDFTKGLNMIAGLFIAAILAIFAVAVVWHFLTRVQLRAAAVRPPFVVAERRPVFKPHVEPLPDTGHHVQLAR